MSPAAGQQRRDEPDELRILHWNIHSWRDMAGAPNTKAVTSLIRDPSHVVSLAEVDEPWGLPSVLAEVAATCGYSWIFGPSFEFGADVRRAQRQGLGNEFFGFALLDSKLLAAGVHRRGHAADG